MSDAIKTIGEIYIILFASTLLYAIGETIICKICKHKTERILVGLYPFIPLGRWIISVIPITYKVDLVEDDFLYGDPKQKKFFLYKEATPIILTILLLAVSLVLKIKEFKIAMLAQFILMFVRFANWTPPAQTLIYVISNLKQSGQLLTRELAEQTKIESEIEDNLTADDKREAKILTQTAKRARKKATKQVMRSGTYLAQKIAELPMVNKKDEIDDIVNEELRKKAQELADARKQKEPTETEKISGKNDQFIEPEYDEYLRLKRKFENNDDKSIM